MQTDQHAQSLKFSRAAVAQLGAILLGWIDRTLTTAGLMPDLTTFELDLQPDEV